LDRWIILDSTFIHSHCFHTCKDCLSPYRLQYQSVQSIDLARLKYYHDTSLDKNADLLTHVSDEVFFIEIDKLADLCLNAENKSWEKFVFVGSY
jgi:hypothetical protein